ncbi:RNA polymerase sigma factor [Cohnella sp. AR92]|uniref:RNA polymerase sigma factor n=1 Tax=Cohnella sp. AR92 TaxID=648716 RepID=UPI000F8DB671|nr:sigma-70 family RNA polymerase sigma factor [Cohnella sp. AR92]RUS45668.1 sigma-70 family RNA polymerase sigma factor [Cohnella sp. AR92]
MEFTKLAAKATAGDSEAFITLIRQLENSLHFMAKSLLSKDEDVADALQETILKAYKAVSALREPKYFKTWIFRILINECRNLIAQHSGSIAYAEVPPVSSYSGDYEKVDLREAVDRLDEPQRLAVILHYFEDLPLRQVARILDISESAVKMRLSRARDALQRSLPNRHEGKMNYGSI